MRVVGFRRRWSVGLAGLAVAVTGLQVATVHPAAAAGVHACVGQYTFTVNNALGLGLGLVYNDNGSGGALGRPCVDVVSGGTSPIVSAGLSSWWTFSNPVNYTGNCVVGAATWNDGGLGVFVGGVLVAANARNDGVLVAALLPQGTPCTGVTGQPLAWTGEANYDYLS